MKTCFRIPTTGAFGNPIDENPSGAMMEAGFKSAGLNWRYQLFQVTSDNLEYGLRGIRALGFSGLNLTIPHKIAAIPFMDSLSDSASLIGAINTILIKDGKLLGENTDGKGFVIGLCENGISLSGKRIVILGAGGAARAIGVESALAGASHVTIINRTASRGEELSALIDNRTSCSSKFIKWTEKVKIPSCDILVNATNIGLFPDESFPDIDYNTINHGMVVQDIITNPADTPFLKKARERGADTLDGQSMLIYQGALAVELWTGRKPDPKAMKMALLKSFQ